MAPCRCSPGRGYRLPPSALVNLSHGTRSETGSQKLTAIVKPQPAASHYISHPSLPSGTLGGLNHSPQSLFVPTQVSKTTSHWQSQALCQWKPNSPFLVTESQSFASNQSGLSNLVENVLSHVYLCQYRNLCR